MEKVTYKTETVEALAAALGKTTRTIYRWLNSGDIRLTTPAAVEIIQRLEKPEPAQ